MIQYRLNLDLASHASEPGILGKFRTIIIKPHRVMNGLIPLAVILGERMMDPRLVFLDRKIFPNETRIQKSINIGVGVKNEARPSQVLDLVLNLVGLD